jgi:HPr kinase/phosphorylase
VSGRITHPRIQKLSLALTGFLQQIRTGRIQVIGETEVRYCEGLGADPRRHVFAEACRLPVTTFLVTKGLPPPPELLEEAEAADVPVIVSGQASSVVIADVQEFLQDRLAPRVRLHAVLLDVYGLGVLLLGESGVGKSECALDLVQRGHRLVADDVVEVRAVGPHLLVGTGPDVLRHHIELRGIGIVNVVDLFGVASVRDRKRIELVMRLVDWVQGEEYERLGLDDRWYEIMGTRVAYLEMPVSAGRNISILVEVAARTHMLKLHGYHPARALVERLDADLERRGRRRGDRGEE